MAPSAFLGFFSSIVSDNSSQIRIVKDTVSPKASKKPNKGYAFIVYEREKDMKGIITKLCR